MNNTGYFIGPPTKAAYQKAQSAELKRQMMLYSAEIFANKLEAFGMKSYHDEGLCWYKVVNGEVLQSVYFISETKYPFLVSVFYGLHPLYCQMKVPMNHYIPTYRLSHDETMIFLRGVERGAKRILPGTTINHILTTERGAEWLDIEVFPLFRTCNTSNSVYMYWKDFYFGSNAPAYCSHAFIDQVIYRDDTALFDACYNQYRHVYNDSPEFIRTLPASWRRTRDDLIVRLDVLSTGNRDPYLAILEQRKQKRLKQLESKLGIKL